MGLVRLSLLLILSFSTLISTVIVIGQQVPADEITFMSKQHSGDIVSMDVRFKFIRPLVDDWAIEETFVWSPDGSQVAFVSKRSHKRDIFVVDADGRNLRQLTFATTDSTKPVWSPDGQSILYQREISRQDNNTDLYIVDVESGTSRMLTGDRANEINPVWSPDGTHVVYITNRRFDGKGFASPMPMNKLFLIEVANRSAALLTTQEGWISDLNWSPDGSYLAFTVLTVTGNQLRLFSVDEQRTVHIIKNARTADWSPDAKAVVYTTVRESIFAEICVFNLVQEQCLTHNSRRHYYAPRWSPEGDRIVFYSDAAKPDLRIMMIQGDGSNLQMLTDGSAHYYTPAWRPLKTR